MLQILYIHIGPPKTGTTSIQGTFFANAALLKENGFYYFAKQRTHHAIADHMHKRTRLPEHRKFYDAFLAAAAASPYRAGLLSSEFLIRLTDEEVAHECRALRAIAQELKLICYARHPVDFAVSSAHQAIRYGKPLDIVEASPNMRRLTPILARWASVLGRDNIIVRPFDIRRMPGGDVVEDFLGCVGLSDLSDKLERVRLNAGLSVLGAHLMDAVARRIEDEPLAVRHVGLLRHIAGPRYVLPPETLARVRRQMADEVKSLAEDWGVILEESQIPPYVPLSLSEEELSSLADAVVQILRLVPNERASRRAARLEAQREERPPSLLALAGRVLPGVRRKRPMKRPPASHDEASLS